MHSIFRHLKAWARRGRLDDELRDELAQHVEWKTESLMADGIPEAEARRRAAVEVGNVTRLREESRSVWGFPSIESVAQDVRYALRQMRRAPRKMTPARIRNSTTFRAIPLIQSPKRDQRARSSSAEMRSAAISARAGKPNEGKEMSGRLGWMSRRTTFSP